MIIMSLPIGSSTLSEFLRHELMYYLMCGEADKDRPIHSQRGRWVILNLFGWKLEDLLWKE